MTTTKIFHLLMLLLPGQMANCLYSQSQIIGGGCIYIGTYDHPEFENKKRVKQHQYFVTDIVINRSESRGLPKKERLDLRFTLPDHPAEKIDLPDVSTTGDGEADKKEMKHRRTMFTGRMKYRWMSMDGDKIFSPQMRTCYANYIVQQLVPHDGCVLDFFSCGTFSRVALLQEKKSVALEYDERKARFLESFFTYLETIARDDPETEDRKDEADVEQEEEMTGKLSGTASDIDVTKQSVISDDLNNVRDTFKVDDNNVDDCDEVLDRLQGPWIVANRDTVDRLQGGMATFLCSSA
jgi:hypothetical protein